MADALDTRRQRRVRPDRHPRGRERARAARGGLRARPAPRARRRSGGGRARAARGPLLLVEAGRPTAELEDADRGDRLRPLPGRGARSQRRRGVPGRDLRREGGHRHPSRRPPPARAPGRRPRGRRAPGLAGAGRAVRALRRRRWALPAAPSVNTLVSEAVPFYDGLDLDEIGGQGVRWQERDAASALDADGALPTSRSPTRRDRTRACAWPAPPASGPAPRSSIRPPSPSSPRSRRPAVGGGCPRARSRGRRRDRAQRRR